MPLTFSPPIAAVRQVPTSPGDATKFLNGATPPAFTSPAGGGGGSAQIPQWTWEAGGGTPSSGKFTTNNDSASATTTIKVSAIGTGGISYFYYFDYPYFILTLINASLDASLFTVSAVVDNTSHFTFTVEREAGSATWSGAFSFLVTPLVFQTLGQINGLIKGDGTGAAASAALAGTDYLAPGGVGITAVLLASGPITPIADNTYTVPGTLSNGSITFVQGICTAYSPPSFI